MDKRGEEWQTRWSSLKKSSFPFVEWTLKAYPAWPPSLGRWGTGDFQMSWVRETQEPASGKAAIRRHTRVLWTSPPGAKETPEKRWGGWKSKGSGFNSTVGMDAYVELLALVKEQRAPMQDGGGKWGDAALLQDKNWWVLEGWHLRAPTIWSRGGGGEQVKARSSGCRQWAWTRLWKAMSRVMKCGTL